MHPAQADLNLPNILYALGDPMRLKVVAQLATAQAGVSCQHIIMGMDVAKSTQSHHLKVLREAGILQMVPQGRRLLVSLRKNDLDARFPGLLEAVLHNCQQPQPLKN